ncbi:TetR/AcrR family transcriptional regulator [Staphylococcus hyicus]|uniref:TetR/AcrR family transcriptional regulator n=1 Tax=Staphylococcus hyicus TaxID=1284 RepID=UPI0005822CEE|nr:TetR/AcrR family transcriptional regulator [Staphylococcus hyicus]AJC95337.1 TetR family transcriptional regulator [Staphylococcus hyicus]MCE5153891.1 TetR/AcrR family transcriptional regulator [Staphylococcus hyicus]MCQ9291343.1 TetR/AcrR family transcriptional regulator [Staphylococcus hyicus]MCQ9306584.1 TetR/AcrR family transcriptional regulator [Staphylococcus hyicus]MCQ9308997.1 TetR/AcrR family transcriptional regulator [Staphylococcus hyicus]
MVRIQKQDLRIIKTISKLTEVLVALLQTQRYSKITINQICSEAKVHRTTFYKHFKDKNELLIHVFEAATQPYFKNDINKRMIQPFTCLEQTLNAPIRDILKTQENDANFYKVLVQFFTQTVHKDVKCHINTLPHDQRFPSEVFGYVQTAIISSLNQWRIDTNTEFDAAKMDHIYQTLMRYRFSKF